MDPDDLRFTEVDPADPAARQAVERYYAELATRLGGFDSASYTAASSAAENGWFLLGTRGDRTVGCGALLPLGSGLVEIKRMWVDPAARGLGLGRRLLKALETLAARLPARAVRLDTHRALIEAIALYERSGYRPIPRYNDNPYAQLWFEKSLPNRDTVEQMFDSPT